MPPEDAAERAGDSSRACRSAGEGGGRALPRLLMPAETWALFKKGEIELVDTRTLAERDLVGYVPGSILIEWYDYPAKNATNDFSMC